MHRSAFNSLSLIALYSVVYIYAYTYLTNRGDKMKENDIGGTGSIFDQVINANILIGKKGRPWCSPSIRRSSEELNFIE
jgi:hypothetical protein